MHARFQFLLGLTFLLAACSQSPAPPAAERPLGNLLEIEFRGASSRVVTRSAPSARTADAQALAETSCAKLGALASQGTFDLAGTRYVQATFNVTNTCATPLTNLSFVAVRRLGANPTLGGTAVTSMKTFGGTNAAATLALQILPAQPTLVSLGERTVDARDASLQVYDDTDGGELDALRAAVDPTGGTYDLLPYGFVATTVDGNRTIPAGGAGRITFAMRVPLQATPQEDVFSFNFLFVMVTNAATTTTQGLEEQDAAGKAAVETRAAKLGARIRTLLGPNMTTATFAKNALALCAVRTAGASDAPAAFLVNASPSDLTVVPALTPLTISGPHVQPAIVATVNGAPFPVLATALKTSTPSVLFIEDNLVRPVAGVPLERKTGGLTATTTCGRTDGELRTTPYHPLVAGNDQGLAVSTTGGLLAWGYGVGGQAGVPSDANSGVVAASAGRYHGLALLKDGKVVPFGDNPVAADDVPSEVQGQTVAVASDDYHNLALTKDGRVVAWGSNDYDVSIVPAEAKSDVVMIAAGIGSSVALKRDGTIVSWGFWRAPSDLPRDIVAISGGSRHFLALTARGRVIAWGSFISDEHEIVPNDLPSDIVAVAAGTFHSLALTRSGRVIAWGDNTWGQSTVPAAAQQGIVAIAGGTTHSLALTGTGQVIAWGSNEDGQLTVPTQTVAIP